MIDVIQLEEKEEDVEVIDVVLLEKETQTVVPKVPKPEIHPFFSKSRLMLGSLFKSRNEIKFESERSGNV